MGQNVVVAVRPVSVVACGNPAAGDDAAACELVRRWQERESTGLQPLEISPGGLELALYSLDHPLLIVDAVVSGAPPGSLHLLKLPSSLVEPRHLDRLSTHGYGLMHTLELARVLGHRLPPVFLLGIEIAGTRSGAPLAPPVLQAIELAADCFQALHELILSVGWSRFRPRRYPPGDTSFPG